MERPVKFVLRRVRKETLPEATAKSVWSRPTRTFLPASIFVPRWRTITIPGRAVAPSASFTPRYFGLESVRFFAEPPALVDAILTS